MITSRRIRRAPGVVLVVVAVLVALTVPGVTGRRIAGTPVVLSIPAPLHVGDCLLQTDPPTVFPSSVVTGGTRVVSCADPHDGEIIFLAASTTEFPVIYEGAASYPDVAECSRAAYPYLGVRPLTEVGDRSSLLGPWWPASIGNFGFVRPGPLQMHAGQHWLACVMVSPQGRVTGPAADVLRDQARKNPNALCLPGAIARLEVSISCAIPHPTEILGWQVADESAGGQTRLDESCAELARRITGMTDPTAMGQISVSAVVIPYDNDGIQWAGFGPGPPSETNRAGCTVSATGSKLLAGSLTGLGNAGVPWA